MKLKIRLISPAGFVLIAILISLVFAIVNACGLQKYMVVLTGTSPAGGYVYTGDVLLAGVYILSGIGFALFVPVLVIASFLFLLFLPRKA